jgi:hypothetical protein
MTTEARLRIVTTVSGDASRKIAGVDRQLRTLESTQERAIRNSARLAGGINAAWDGVGKTLFSVRNLVIGLGAGAGGKTLLENTIGSASQINQSRGLLQLVLRDAEKVEMAEQRALDLVKEIPSLDFSKALTGMSKLALVGGKNVEKTAELVRLAKALEGIAPEQGFEGALFAIKELESGDTMSLRERFGFRLPTQEEAKREAKKARKTVQQYYLDELNKLLEDTYEGGVTGLLKKQNESVEGQLAQLKTAFTSQLATIGQDAARELVPALRSLNTEMSKVTQSEDFKQFIRDSSDLLKDASLGAVELAKRLPQIVKDTRAFVEENKTYLALGGGVLAANALSGGAVRRKGVEGISNLVTRGIPRALFGKGKAGALASELGGGSDALPVYVVNMGEGGMGGGLAGASKGGSAARMVSGLTMGGQLAQGGLVGAASSFGVGTVAGMMAIPAAFAGAALTLHKSSKLTVRNLEIADRLAADGYGTQATDSRTGKTVTTIRKEQAESDAEMDKRLKHEAEYQEELRKATGGVRSMLDAAQLSSSPELIRETIRAVAIETNRSFAGTRDKAGMSAAMNNQLGGMGLAVSYDKRTNRARYGIDQSLQDELKRMQSDQEYAAIAGQRLGTGTVDPKTEARLAAVESRFSQAENMAKELNRVKIDRQEIHLHVQNLNSRGDALNAARDLREAFQSELQKVE